MSRLTPHSIKRITLPTAERGPEDHPDALVTGLTLCVRPSGVMTWTLRYRAGGVGKRFTIGKYPMMNLKTARKRAQALLLQVADGTDPSAEKQAARSGEIVDAFPAIAAKFIEQHSRLRNRSWIDQARVLGLRYRRSSPSAPLLIEGSPADRWSKRSVGSLTKREIAELISEQTARGLPQSANKLHATFARFFRWANEQGIIEQTPMMGMCLPAPTTSRERALDLHELSLVWRATDALGSPFNAFVRLLVLTGQRRNEVAGMAESELTHGTWTIPGNRTKNGREHEVPLSSAARETIAALPRNSSGLLFTTNSRTAISGFSKMKAALDREIARLRDGRSIPAWTLHDLRRTCRTGLAALDVPPHVAEHVLNHVSGTRAGVVGTYDRHAYSAEKRRALAKWAEHVLAAVEVLS